MRLFHRLLRRSREPATSPFRPRCTSCRRYALPDQPTCRHHTLRGGAR